MKAGKSNKKMAEGIRKADGKTPREDFSAMITIREALAWKLSMDPAEFDWWLRRLLFLRAIPRARRKRRR